MRHEKLVRPRRVGPHDRAVGRARAELERGLAPHLRERGPAHAVGDRCLVGRGRELVDRADPRRVQPCALRLVHPAHEQHVAVGLDLRPAVGAAPARPDRRVVPGRAAVAHDVLGREPHEPVAPVPEHGQEVREAVGRALARAEHERDVGVDGHARGLELVAVRGELKERGDLGAPRELGVDDGVAGRPRVVGAGPDEEVRAPVEGAVEEGRLVHDVGAGLERGERARLRGHEIVPGDPARRLEAHDAASRRRVERAVRGLVAREDLALVPRAERGGAREHGVLRRVGTRGPAELLVEPAQEPVLALGGDDEVARRVHEGALARGRAAGGGPARVGRCGPQRRLVDEEHAHLRVRGRPPPRREQCRLAGLRPFYQRPPTTPGRRCGRASGARPGGQRVPVPSPARRDSCRRPRLPYCSRRTRSPVETPRPRRP